MEDAVRMNLHKQVSSGMVAVNIMQSPTHPDNTDCVSTTFQNEQTECNIRNATSNEGTEATLEPEHPILLSGGSGFTNTAPAKRSLTPVSIPANVLGVESFRNTEGTSIGTTETESRNKRRHISRSEEESIGMQFISC